MSFGLEYLSQSPTQEVLIDVIYTTDNLSFVNK